MSQSVHDAMGRAPPSSSDSTSEVASENSGTGSDNVNSGTSHSIGASLDAKQSSVSFDSTAGNASSSPDAESGTRSETEEEKRRPNTLGPSKDMDIPPQLHAGRVGYGPNYNQAASLSDKLAGLKDEIKGKITKNPELVEHGRELRTGELKKKLADSDENSPFKSAEDSAGSAQENGEKGPSESGDVHS